MVSNLLKLRSLEWGLTSDEVVKSLRSWFGTEQREGEVMILEV